MKIVVSCDSTCDLGEELISKNDIRVMPLIIYLGEDQFSDNVDVTTKDIQVDVGEDGGEFCLDYTIQFNHDAPVRNGMHVTIRKVGSSSDNFRTDEEYA